jgi:Protein of unknown function (DUF3180)
MKPTSIRFLVAVAIVVGALVYILVAVSYGDLPPVPLFAPATLAFLGIAELLTALSVSARLQHRPGTRPIDPLVVARLVALAKASSFVGALAFGAYGAILGYVVQSLDNPHKAHDAAAGGFGAAAALLLVIAGLFLERVCRVEGPPDDEPPPPPEWDPLRDWHQEDRRR